MPRSITRGPDVVFLHDASPKRSYVDRLRFERGWRDFFGGAAWSAGIDGSATFGTFTWWGAVPFFVVRVRALAAGRA